MPRQRSRKSSKRDDAVDLSTIFIGRQQQLDLFEMYLHRWKNLIFDADADQPLVPVAPSPNTKLQGLLVLLYGRGGFGKSTLLRHYRTLVVQENQNPLMSKVTASEIIDWEFAVEGKRSLFNPPQGQEVDAHEYYEVLCGQFAIALGKKPTQFQEYQAARSAVKQAQQEAAQLLGSLKDDDRNAALRDMTVDGVMTALSITTPPPVSTIAANKTVQGTARGGAKLLDELPAHLKQRLHDRLGEKLGDFLDPALRLGLALGRDLSLFARDFPLVMFHDTYEEIDEGDRLLRIVMGAAGLRVGWVLTGRDNVWAGAGQIERSIALEYGYKEIVPSDRGLAVDFNVGGVGAFTTSDIKDYFDLLCKKVDYVPQLPKITAEGAKRILDVTKGVPLAVKIAAGLYLDTADLDIITEQVEGKREIVDQMVRRYLLHARDDQSERAKLYGLAMLRRADQPMAVAAALGLTPVQMNTSYAKELSLLHRRYSFIFTEKEEPSLHQEVRTFLRLWLLERYDEPEIQAINERLKAAHETSLSRLEDSRNYASLKARCEDEQWVGTYVDLTEQQFWLDPVEGVRYALPLCIVASLYDWFTAQEVLRVGRQFETRIGLPYINLWKWTTEIRELPQLEKLKNVIYEYNIDFPYPVPNHQDLLLALLWVLLGNAYIYVDYNKAQNWYEKALKQSVQEVELREEVVRKYLFLARSLYVKSKYAECISLLNRAIELQSDYGDAYELRGNVYSYLKNDKQAIEDFNRAIELNPPNAVIYTQRGIAYGNMWKHEQAIEDFNRAIELKPTFEIAYANRGNNFNALAKYEQALEDCNRAIELDPLYTHGYIHRNYVYQSLEKYEQALEDCNRAIELDPSKAEAYIARGSAYESLKKYEQALEDCNRAIELDPGSADAYATRGEVFLELNEFKKAIQDCDHAIKLNPNLDYAFYYRGLAYLWLRDANNAMDSFNRRWSLNQTNIKVVYLMVWLRTSKERSRLETAEQLQTAALFNPQHYGAFVCRGIALGLQGKLKEGLAELERAIPLESNVPGAYFWKGMICAYLGRNTAAIEAIEQSLELHLPPVLLTPLYWLEKDRSDFFEKYARRLLELHNI